jgi:hypothetical protein
MLIYFESIEKHLRYYEAHGKCEKVKKEKESVDTGGGGAGENQEE